MVENQAPPCLDIDLWREATQRSPLPAPDRAPVNLARRAATTVRSTGDRGAEVQFSIIVNVFNHEATIERVLRQVFKLTTESFEVIVFFDGCTDASLARARAVLQRYLAGWPRCTAFAAAADSTAECIAAADQLTAVHRTREPTVSGGDSAATPGFAHVRYIVQPPGNSVYETSGNNVAMRAATGRFLILMQDDMYLTEPGWNSRLAAAVREHDDVVSVSAMCAHTLHPLGQDKVGPCGAPAGYQRRMARAPPGARDTFVVRPTSNRGPLLLDAAKAHTLGYLDEYNYRIMNDDHDFHCRAALERGWVTGHLAVGFSVNVAEGGVRVNKKRAKPPYERQFIAARAARYNGRDCFRARKAEYVAAVANGTVVTSGRRRLTSLGDR